MDSEESDWDGSAHWYLKWSPAYSGRVCARGGYVFLRLWRLAPAVDKLKIFPNGRNKKRYGP